MVTLMMNDMFEYLDHEVLSTKLFVMYKVPLPLPCVQYEVHPPDYPFWYYTNYTIFKGEHCPSVNVCWKKREGKFGGFKAISSLNFSRVREIVDIFRCRLTKPALAVNYVF